MHPEKAFPSCVLAGSSVWHGCNGTSGNMVCDTLQFPCLLFPHGWGKGNGNNTSEWITGKLRKKNTHTHTHTPPKFFSTRFLFCGREPNDYLCLQHPQLCSHPCKRACVGGGTAANGSHQSLRTNRYCPTKLACSLNKPEFK